MQVSFKSPLWWSPFCFVIKSILNIQDLVWISHYPVWSFISKSLQFALCHWHFDTSLSPYLVLRTCYQDHFQAELAQTFCSAKSSTSFCRLLLFLVYGLWVPSFSFFLWGLLGTSMGFLESFSKFAALVGFAAASFPSELVDLRLASFCIWFAQVQVARQEYQAKITAFRLPFRASTWAS